MKELKFAIFGTGFWSNYQIPGWQELEGVKCVAAYNRTLDKAQNIADKFGIPKVYDDPTALLDNEEIDFIDICTDVDTHLTFTKLAAERGIDIVCQKPMAPSFDLALEMLEICKKNNVRLFINENFRWQAPIRYVKKKIDSGIIGDIFKARISFCSAFPVFENQPFLAELEHFILTDVGSHILDICRFLFGEAQSLYCTIHQVNPKIKGEDVANVFMKMEKDISCFAEISYASILKKEAFPEVLMLIEGSKGSIELSHDRTVYTVTERSTAEDVIIPPIYPWINKQYALVHSSIVDCQKNILKGLRGEPCEMTGEDNLKTVKLVWDSYSSAEKNKSISY